MKDQDIKKAFTDIILTLEDCPEIVHAGYEGTGAKPYLTFEHIPVSRVDRTLKGGGEIVRGYVVVGAVGNLNSEDDQEWAQKVKDLFPFPLAIEVEDEFVHTSKPAEFLVLLSDDNMKRQDVRIDYVSG